MARKKLDPRLFMGVCLGIGAASGVALKTWFALADSVPPFWLWALPVLFLGLGLVGWLGQRRQHAAIRQRLERQAMVRRPSAAEPDDALAESLEGRDAP